MSRKKPWFVVLGGVAAGALLLAPAASAAELSGPWAPFSHCPVDDPAMAGAPPSTFGTACVSSVAESGTFKIGNTKVTTGLTELQMGVAGSDGGDPVIVPASGGETLHSDTVTVPGGLLGLTLANDAVGNLLNGVVSSGTLGVRATVELVGLPSDFDGNAALGSGDSIVTLPVRVHLQNTLLGSKCYIGSAQDPIILKPELTTAPADQSVAFFTGGFIIGFNATLADDSFTVPKARGCGLAGLLDGVVNAKLGLPSPSGANLLQLDDTQLTVALTQQGGQALHDAWHSALTSP